MDARALAVSALFHVCAAGALGRAFAPTAASREESRTTASAALAIEIEVPDAIEVDAPKPRSNGSLAGSDRAGAVRASGPNRAMEGERGEDNPSTTADARFGMVALLDSSRGTSAGADTSWAPRAGGGADGLYAGSALGDGLSSSGLGIGAARDGLGVGMGTIGTRGLSGNAPGALSNVRAWSDAWHGYENYAHYGSRHPRFGPRIRHPARLAPIGPLDGAVIVRVVRGHDSVLLRCYAKSLETHRDLAGELRVDFMIDREGTVVAAKDGGGPAGADALLVACMTKAFESFELPSAPAFTRVSYAMDLQPR